MNAIFHRYMVALIVFGFSVLLICYAFQITLVIYMYQNPYIALKLSFPLKKKKIKLHKVGTNSDRIV